MSSICGDAGERELCEKIGGKFTEGKTCEAMGYQCDEHGNNCSKK